jgi:hypothetical protein
MVLLDDLNWLNYLKMNSTYKCISCFRESCNQYYNNAKNNKQLGLYRARKSAVIFSYGNECVECKESDYGKLIIHCINSIDTKYNGQIYNLLYNNPITDGYCVLCYNCNSMKVVKNKYLLSYKTKVLDNYGGKCLICNEFKVEKLVISRNEKGAEIRRLLGCNSSSVLYRWIIKNDYPPGLEIKCLNCESDTKSIKKIKT